MAPAASSVAQLLNTAQDSAAACERSAGALWRLILQDPDAHFQELTQCVDLLLTVSQKSPHVNLCLRLFACFAAKASPNCETSTAVVEELLKHVCGHAAAADKAVRLQACLLLQQLLAHLPQQLGLEASVLECMTDALTQRLQDKQVAIRAAAVAALCELLDVDEDPYDAVTPLTALLECDKSKDVRAAVVSCLPLGPATLPLLLARARDVHPAVRKALVARLQGLSIKVLSIRQRASVLQQLLQDRDSGVAQAAGGMLAHWLAADCGGDPLLLLQLLDVETYTDAAACALQSLISSNSIHPPGAAGTANRSSSSSSQPSVIAYVKAAAAAAADGGSGGGLVSLRALCQQQQQQGGSRGKGVGLLEPHEALLWRCLCEWLQSDAVSRGMAAAATGGVRATVEAAVANERHEALESLLPDTAGELMGLVLSHTAAGPRARFAATQLLLVAAHCMEWTDASSRDGAAPLLLQLMALDPTRDTAATPAPTAVSSRQQGKKRGGAQQAEPEDEETQEADGLQLSGNGGDGTFEGAVVGLVAALQGGPASPGFSAAMLEGLAALAAAAGLLRKPSSSPGAAAAGGMEEQEEEEQEHQFVFTVGVADSSQVLQVLTYVRLLLQQLPMNINMQQQQQGASAAAAGVDGLLSSSSSSSTAIISLESLWELLLLLALKSEHVAVRAAAVECVGLYAAAAAPANPRLLASAASLLGPLLSSGHVPQAVRTAAVRALADLGLLFGPAAVDAALLLGAGKQQQQGAEGGADGAGAAAAAGDSSSSSSRCLLELLLEQGEGLLAEAQAAGGGAGAAKKATTGRASTKSKARQQDEDSSSSGSLSPAAAELMAAVAEALAKLLLHQRNWLRRYSSSSNNAATAADTGVLPPDSQAAQARLLQRSLALLLQLQFHPASAGVAQVCQRLSVFFDVFCAATLSNRLQLAAATVPAARQALHVCSTKKHPAPLLVKYVLQLLQQARLRQQEQDEQQQPQQQQQQAASWAVRGLLGESFASVAHQMVCEVAIVAPITVGVGHQPAKFKPYLAALLKVVCELPLAGPPHDHHQHNNPAAAAAAAAARSDLRVLQFMADDLSVRVTDAVLLKDVAALQQHLQVTAAAGLNTAAAGGRQGGRVGSAAAAGSSQQQQQPEEEEQQLDDEAIEQLVQRVQGLSLVQLPALPDGLLAQAAAAGGAAGSGRANRSNSSTATAAAAKAPAAAGRGRGRPSAAASRKAAAAAASSSSDDNADDSSSDDESSDSDAEPAAAAAPAARRRSSVAAAAAAAAAESDDYLSPAPPAAAAAEGGDSEGFATADDDSDDDGIAVDAGSSRPRRRSAAAAANAAAADGSAGAVSEYSDSEGGSSSSDSDADESSSTDGEQQEQAPAAVAARSTTSGKQQAGGVGGVRGGGLGRARREPLAPSSMVNSSMVNSSLRQQH